MSAVGVCLGTTGATLAVVEPTATGWRLAAVAEVDWPNADPTRPVAARLLGRARRMLALPRPQAVAVTALPGIEELDGRVAGVLLARAGLVRRGTVDGRAAAGPGEHAVTAIDPLLEPDLARAAGTEAARRAAGAAIAAATPGPVPSPRLTSDPPPPPPLHLGVQEIGWSVQRIGDPGGSGAEPPGHLAAKAGRHPLDDDADIAGTGGTDAGGTRAGWRHARRGDPYR